LRFPILAISAPPLPSAANSTERDIVRHRTIRTVKMWTWWYLEAWSEPVQQIRYDTIQEFNVDSKAEYSA